MNIDDLYEDAMAGDADAIAKLEKQADKLSEILGTMNCTILHIESWKGNAGHVRFILRKFANKNLLVRLNKGSQTALHLAAYYGHPEVVEILIDAARQTFQDNADLHNPVFSSFQAFFRHLKGGDTPLTLAVMQGQLAIVKMLVKADPTYRHSQNQNGRTPIYMAVEYGYKYIVKEICTACTALSLDGPGGDTALHFAIRNMRKANEEDEDVIRMIINAAKRSTTPENAAHVSFEALFQKIDQSGSTILELAVKGNHVNVVELILSEDPAYQHGAGRNKINGLMHLIYHAVDDQFMDVAKLLSETYEAGQKGAAALILAIKRGDKDGVLRLLGDAKHLVTFTEDEGWTPLHYAASHGFDSILDIIIESQKDLGYPFVYKDLVQTPLLVAAEKRYTSTVIRLMELWPTSSSAYTAINNYSQNILHLAATANEKEMVQGILKYCPQKYMDKILKQQDNHGDTPFHVLIGHGCFIPELLKLKGLDTMVRNKSNWTPQDMLYSTDNVIADQVQIKFALDHVQIDHKRDIFSSSSVLSISKRERKDVIFKKQANLMIYEKHAQMKEDTHAIANCFAEAIAGDAISRAALEMKADTLDKEGKTILHVESIRGDTERVRYIVKEFANINLLVKLDRFKQTALQHAAHHGHTQVVKVLLDAARHLPSSSANDYTHDRVGSFQEFSRQANVQMGNTALHIAVLNGNVEIVKLLVQADPNDNHVQNNEGKTPVYIAVEKGYKDIIKEICSTCTALCLDGPGRTTALHALIQNVGQVTEGASDVIKEMVNAAKRWSNIADFEALFCRTDELERTVLQMAMERNYVDAVRLILQEDPAYQHGGEIKRSHLMLLICKALDNKYSDDIIKLLSQIYEAGINHQHKNVLDLILAIKRLDEDTVLGILEDSKHLVNFAEDNGWTPLHYAASHEFDSIIGAIIEAQEEVGHQFVYGNMVSTPFDVAVKNGFTSTLLQLMELWPASSSASVAANSPYTAVNKDGQNILHVAAADNNKEMVQGILKYCPEKYKEKILKQQDINGDTPLHLLISHGCFIPELIKHKGLDTMAKNKNNFTPRDMLYVKDDIVADQVQIKIALDGVQTNQSIWKVWPKSTEKKPDIWKSNKISQSKRKKKDGKFEEGKKFLMDAKHEQMKKDLERYKMRTNTQIIVTALITTVTFTVGFTMPGGLYQSGDVNEGLVVLFRKTAFNVFMVSDVLALLLSTSSLFFYFLESMNEDPRQVSKLNAASTVLNIVSVIAMMLTFIAGTYVVLSHSPALAITVSVIGSLFFLLIIVLSIRIVYDRKLKRNED